MNTHCIYSWSDFIDQVITQKCWTAWRNEERKNKTTGEVKITKVPYRTVTSEARSNDPTTWLCIEDAAAVAATKGFINGFGGGVGLWLGIVFGNEYRLGGVDLDTCLSPQAGPTPWAQEVVDRFQTYGEVSPSKTGVKLFFFYDYRKLESFRQITGTRWTRNFKERTGGEHPPGYELHLGNRYFAMTGYPYDGCPDTLRVIDVGDIKWLINEMGARFAKAKQPTSMMNGTGAPNGEATTNHTDNSRSAQAMRYATKLWHDGDIDSYEELKPKMLNAPDSGVRDWTIEKGLTRGEYELDRMWKKIRSRPRDIDRIRREMEEMDREAALYPQAQAVWADGQQPESDEPSTGKPLVGMPARKTTAKSRHANGCWGMWCVGDF